MHMSMHKTNSEWGGISGLKAHLMVVVSLTDLSFSNSTHTVRNKRLIVDDR